MINSPQLFLAQVTAQQTPAKGGKSSSLCTQLYDLLCQERHNIAHFLLSTGTRQQHVAGRVTLLGLELVWLASQPHRSCPHYSIHSTCPFQKSQLEDSELLSPHLTAVSTSPRKGCEHAGERRNRGWHMNHGRHKRKEPAFQ